VTMNFDTATVEATALGEDLKAAFASAGSSLEQLWHHAAPTADDAPVEPVAPPAPPPKLASATRTGGSAPTSAPTPTPTPTSAPPASASTPVLLPARPPAHVSAPAPASAPVRAPAVLPVRAPASNGTTGRSRIELAADTIEVPPDDSAARIVVRRSGSVRGSTSFSWWTESGTAKPGQDFATVAPHEERIEDGKGSVSLFIPVVADARRRQARSFYVVISDPSPGAVLGARTLTMVTLPAAE
jgi:hypothetical protein